MGSQHFIKINEDLVDRWHDHDSAWRFLQITTDQTKLEGFHFFCAMGNICPLPGHVITEDDMGALCYLTRDWDYTYCPAPLGAVQASATIPLADGMVGLLHRIDGVWITPLNDEGEVYKFTSVDAAYEAGNKIAVEANSLLGVETPDPQGE